MVEVELTMEQYATLVWFKNYMTLRLREVTNQEVLNKMIPCDTNPFGERLPDNAVYEYDLEPEYTYGECIKDIIDCVMDEQRTGEVNYIT